MKYAYKELHFHIFNITYIHYMEAFDYCIRI